MDETKRFTKNDGGFVCANCGAEAPPLGYSSRNHCPRCLCSLHVDINPGDRQSQCGGLMIPQKTEPHPKKGFIITHKCSRCGQTARCRAALGGERPDDIELLIKLTAGTNNGQHMTDDR